MKDAYEACLDEDAIKQQGLDPLLHVVREIQAKYPLVKDTDSKAIMETVLFLHELGITALVSPGTGPDDRDPDKVVVSVSPPWSFGLPSKERYEDGQLVEKYKQAVAQVLSEIFPDAERDSFYNVVEFEKRLAAAAPTQQEREDVTYYYNPMSLDDASALTPEVDLSAMLSKLSDCSACTQRIIVAAPSYMKELSKIISDTPAETLQGYFVWKAVQSMASFVDTPAVKPYKQFANELQGKVT
jgi:endothelin-converting enzyme